MDKHTYFTLTMLGITDQELFILSELLDETDKRIVAFTENEFHKALKKSALRKLKKALSEAGVR